MLVFPASYHYPGVRGLIGASPVPNDLIKGDRDCCKLKEQCVTL